MGHSVGSNSNSKAFQERTIDSNIESATSMALDKTGTFLYYAQCCGKCIISRINVNEKETPEAEVVYSDFGKTCYNLAIVEDKLFFDLTEEGTTFRQQQGLDGKWEAVPWGSTGVDDSREWRWAHSNTSSIMQINLGNTFQLQDPIIFKRNNFPIKFFTTVEPDFLYVGFEGPTYGAEGSKVVRYNIKTQEQDIILEDINVKQAMVVQDFIIYTTPSRYSPGNTGKLYRKLLGSNEDATLVASDLASPEHLCQTQDEILLNGLGGDTKKFPKLQQAIISFTTDSLPKTKQEIIPKVLKDGIQSNGMAC